MRGVVRLQDASYSFESFWAAWPVKKARVKALIVWRKLKPDESLVAEIVAAVERQKASDAWQRDDGRYIPHAATWLNGRRWEDDLASPVAAYSTDEVAVFDAYNAALPSCGWPSANLNPFSAERAAAVRKFLCFGTKPGWFGLYFAWLAEKLPPLEGLGFDWVIRHSTYLRAKEGNFSALREAS